MSPRRTFSKEFKIEAVKLVVEQGQTVVGAAESLGISADSLHRWKKEYLESGEVAFPGQGRSTPENEELRRLRRELAIAKQEAAILKKAMAYFTKDET